MTTTVYDNTGMVQSTTDPLGTVTYFTYDAAGREVQRIMNYRNLSSSSSGARRQQLQQRCLPRIRRHQRHHPHCLQRGRQRQQRHRRQRETGNQVTQYVYGSTLPPRGSPAAS